MGTDSMADIFSTPAMSKFDHPEVKEDMTHPIATPVLAIPCFSIFADYDGNAPDTESFFLVATEELAREVVEILNEDPQSWVALGCVDGYEWSKSFKYTGHFVAVGKESSIFTSIAALKETEYLEKDEDRGDDEED